MGRVSRETAAERKNCSVEIFLCPFKVCHLPLTSWYIKYQILVKYYITQQPTAGLNVANYNNTTYFQLWTKCRDWSRSKPAENAAEKKTGISLATDILIHQLLD